MNIVLMFFENIIDDFIYRKLFLKIIVEGDFVDVLNLWLVGEMILEANFRRIIFYTKVDRYNFKWIVRDRHC